MQLLNVFKLKNSIFTNTLLMMLVAVLLCAIPKNSYAVGCNAIFSAGVRTHGLVNQGFFNLNYLNFDACGVQVLNNPSTTIDTVRITGIVACKPTCTTADCSATGSQVPNIDAGSYQSTSVTTDISLSSGTSTMGTGGTYTATEFDNITLTNSATLTFTTSGQTYKIDRLDVQDNATVNLVAGDYWISVLRVIDNATINVVGGGTARIFTEDNTDTSVFRGTSQINVGNGAEKLLVYAYGSLRIRDTVQANAVIYGQERVIVLNNAQVGGVITANRLEFEDNATFTYDANAAANVDFGTLLESQCSGGDCTPTFANPLQNHDDPSKDESSTSTRISFECDTSAITGGVTALATNNLINPTSTSCNTNTCGTGFCLASGTPAPSYSLGTFETRSSSTDVTVATNGSATIGSGDQQIYDDVNVNSGGTLNFSSHSTETVYYIKYLNTGSNATINFVPGTYWIEDFEVSFNNTINIVGTGLVTIITQEENDYEDGTTINVGSGRANAAQYYLHYGFNDIDLEESVQAEGFFYSQDLVLLKDNANVTGGVFGQYVEMWDDSVISYDATAATALDVSLNNFCTGTGIPSAVTHFVLSHANSAVYCVGENITVTAKDTNNDTVQDYTQTVVLDTGTNKGTWIKITGNGSFSDSTANDGLATYTFHDDDDGIATFQLAYTEGATTVDVEVYQQSNTNIRDDETSGNITFFPQGLLMTEAAVPSSPTGTPASYAVTQTAGVSDTIHLTAYGQLPFGSCGVIETYTGNKNLKFWMDYENPNSGSIVATVDSTSVGTNESSAQTINNISFTSGRASVTTRYRDVGQIQLHVKDDSGASTISGSTGSYIVKPAQFVVTVPSNPSPAPTDHTGGILAAAGDPFTVRVTVQDNDGNTTPNYGNEGEGISIYSSTLVSPSGGRNGSQNNGEIANATAFTVTGTPGVFEGTTFSFDEVGIIRLTAEVADQNYLGQGNVSGPESGNIGRFTANHFAVTTNTPDFTAACSNGGFSYLNQNFNYGTSPQITITAESAGNTTTQNYTGDYWKITDLSVIPTYSSNSTQAALDATNAELSTSVAVNDAGNGTGTVTLSDGGGISFDKITSQLATNFNAEVQLSVDVQDGDSVAASGNPVVFGGTSVGTGMTFTGSQANNNEIRHGILIVGNANGSDLMSLSMPFETRYFDGSSFATNTLDNCTVFNDPNHVLLAPDPVSLSTNASVSTFVNGIGSLTLSTPTGSTAGEVDVEIDLSTATGANLPHLQHDWPFDGNADGVSDDNPQATATFGIYEGEENIVFIREVY